MIILIHFFLDKKRIVVNWKNCCCTKKVWLKYITEKNM